MQAPISEAEKKQIVEFLTANPQGHIRLSNPAKSYDIYIYREPITGMITVTRKEKSKNELH